jgi:hypothetical protein
LGSWTSIGKVTDLSYFCSLSRFNVQSVAWKGVTFIAGEIKNPKRIWIKLVFNDINGKFNLSLAEFHVFVCCSFAQEIATGESDQDTLLHRNTSLIYWTLLVGGDNYDFDCL